MAGDDSSQALMEPLLNVTGLTKHFARPRLLSGGRELVRALDGVSFSVASGTTLALVGRSGSGKSTLGLCLAGLQRPTTGKIVFEGRDMASLPEAELRTLRPRVQLVFQDPAASLNPRFTVEELLAEPLRVQKKLGRRDCAERVRHLLERVGLSPAMAGRRPAQFSGGQRQRLAIARALALDPRILILDEALSALDCSTQAQIANLLTKLQPVFGLTCILITHDLQMAAWLADEIAVIERGTIIERGAPQDVLRYPQHPAAQALVAATAAAMTGGDAPRFSGGRADQ
jgi:ABC-type glutathione transport system ATPase component